MIRSIAISLVVVASACDVGSVLANTGSGDDGGSDCPAVGTIPTPYMHMDDGTSHAGKGCIVAGCHADTSAGQPIFNYAGTLYTSAAGTTGLGGVNVLITIGGMTKKTMTDADGNFYIEDPLLPAPTALMTGNTKVCQGPTPMSGSLAPGNGNCSSSLCHIAGGTQGPIHSP